MKIIAYLFMLLHVSSAFTNCSIVPETIKQSYGTHFYQAFAYQSVGKSVAASAQFQAAYDSAKKAGENIYRLIIIEQLFVWYRMYGSSLQLFAKNPEGYDRIIGEYKRPYSPSNSYMSEWGKTPEQAAMVREFMLGVAETISGVFCISVGSIITANVGVGLFVDGSRRMVTTLSQIWANHERAIVELKKWEETSKNAIEVNSIKP